MKTTSLLVVLCCLTAGIANAATDIYVRLLASQGGPPLVNGDSLAEDFPGSQGWFVARSVAFGIENVIDIDSIGGWGGAGKATFTELNAVKLVNEASATLFTRCATGQNIPEMEIVFVNQGGTTTKGRKPYLEASFLLVLVQSVGLTGSEGDDQLEEDVVFQYGAQRFRFYQFKPDGTRIEAPAETVWSRVLNKASYSI